MDAQAGCRFANSAPGCLWYQHPPHQRVGRKGFPSEQHEDESDCSDDQRVGPHTGASSLSRMPSYASQVGTGLTSIRIDTELEGPKGKVAQFCKIGPQLDDLTP